MKLNTWMRQAFIESVMNDVPEVTVTRDEVQAKFVENFSPNVLAIFADEKTRGNLRTDSMSCGDAYHRNIVVGDQSYELTLAEYYEATAARNALRSKIIAITKTAKTTEQLKSLFPDLEFHIPGAEKPPTPGVPMVIDIMSDLAKCGYKHVSSSPV